MSGDSYYMGSQGSSVIKVFDMTAATTGVNETNAKKAGLDVDTVIRSPMSHAGYDPGGKVMTMKVVFEQETHRLLGAQFVGCEGVDKRIDVLATAIRAGLRATELKDLDLSYAPPYSSAKDPVNMAGFMIENISNGILRQPRLRASLLRLKCVTKSRNYCCLMVLCRIREINDTILPPAVETWQAALFPDSFYKCAAKASP